jgi:hypothetical protein
MAKLGIITGTSPNDGTGDSLLEGAIKINSNFTEIYTTFGDGNNLTGVSTSNVATALTSISINNLSDVNSGSATTGQVLKWSGTEWQSSDDLAGISTTVGIITSTSFESNSTVGDGTDIGFATRYYITASGSSAYRFAGPGVLNTTNNPTFYLHRGFTYIFENSTGAMHPFRIQFTGTTTGVSTYISGIQTGVQIFTVPFDAPPSYEYQCTFHVLMKGTFNIVS